MTHPYSENEPSGRVFRELQRIFGEAPEGSKAFVILPLVDEEDALEFLRTIPTGTSIEQLVPLASAYRAANPRVAPELDGPDRDQAL